MGRTTSRHADLARRGFRDPARAEATLAGWPVDVVGDIAASPAPDQVALSMRQIVDAAPEMLARLTTDSSLRRRLIGVCAASEELARGLSRHPVDLDALVSREDLEAVCHATDADEMRRAYRRALLAIAADDVTAPDPTRCLPDVARRLSDLADATLQGALAVARRETGEAACRLAVVAMGKCGARELNYVSDVDVIFVVEPTDGASAEQATRDGTRWASAMMRICSAHTGAGSIWQVDANLRPEGKHGPLVRTLDSMRSYYRQWAKPWEFQALMKARPAAGDLSLGQDFVDLVTPYVWTVGDTPGFVADTQAMRRRVVSLLPAKETGREIKLGAGGLRDVEFTVQLLQLIHGRRDASLRVADTLTGIDALVEGGYVGRDDGAALAGAYRFLRVLEHRAQLLKLRRTHLLPDDPEAQDRLAAELGVDDVAVAWLDTSRRVLALHRKIFYSPILAAVATVRSAELALDSDAAQARMAGLGYVDAPQALRHIRALTSGLSRAAQIRRQLMPALLGWFADAANPDAGLLAFRQVSEALGDSPWYLRALRDEGAMAERLARILASGRYATDLIMRDPQAVEVLASPDNLAPRPIDAVAAEMATVAARHDAPETAVAAIRTVRRRELLRLAAADILGLVDIDDVGRALADLTSATVDAALTVANRGAQVPLGVVALGRWGGRESAYGSDADSLFVVADADAVPVATRVVGELRRLLSAPGPDPSLVIDADLRPEGRNGPLVRDVASYRAYYERWASPWEAQALLRARWGAGERNLVDDVIGAVSGFRWPAGGPSSAAVAEIRHLKARMETERGGREAARNLKLGPGGLSDVEWCAQLLQLRHAFDHPSVRATSTVEVLTAAVEAGLLEASDAEALTAAWRLAARIRNGTTLVRGRASDLMPADAQVAAAVGQLLGYGRSGAADLAEDWMRASRRARAAAGRVFWED